MPAKLPKIRKSSRHSKITGDFAEALVLYFLSKHGFECARVDHTGIDLIAKHPKEKRSFGISVKCRSREHGDETSRIRVGKDNLTKCRAACAAFGCDPYFAFVVDAVGEVYAFVVPEARFLKHSKTSGGRTLAWRMDEKWKEKYAGDSEVMRFHMNYSFERWWK